MHIFLLTLFAANTLAQRPPPPSGGGTGTNTGTTTDYGSSGTNADGSAFTASGPTAVSLLGTAGLTTVTIEEGSDVTFGTGTQIGEDINGPFEAGFGSTQDFVLEAMGCDPPSLGYLDGGLDTELANDIVNNACGLTLSHLDLDDCGGHTSEYHLHELLTCLYDEDAEGHSTQVGQGLDGQYLYGKWESTNEEPKLDACGGHYGEVPDQEGVVYHYHVQDAPPFTFGCYGPNADGSLVTVEQCRALYDSCDGALETYEVAGGSVDYNLYCSCYDANGSNTGIEIAPLAVFTEETATDAPVDDDPTVEPTAQETTTEPETTTAPETTTTTTTTSTTSAATTSTVASTTEPTTTTPAGTLEPATIAPTEQPSAMPTMIPTEQPTAMPTMIPTEQPTAMPTMNPTEQPTAMPSMNPTVEPTRSPSKDPTSAVDCVTDVAATKATCMAECGDVTAVASTEASGAGDACPDHTCIGGDGDCPVPMATKEVKFDMTLSMTASEFEESKEQVKQGVANKLGMPFDSVDVAVKSRRLRRSLRRILNTVDLEVTVLTDETGSTGIENSLAEDDFETSLASEISATTGTDVTVAGVPDAPTSTPYTADEVTTKDESEDSSNTSIIIVVVVIVVGLLVVVGACKTGIMYMQDSKMEKQVGGAAMGETEMITEGMTETKRQPGSTQG